MIESVILDLDHTLIYCPTKVYAMPHSSFNFKTHRTFFNGFLYLVYERPFLGEFLRSLRGKKIAVWTAASSEYADFIVEHILKPYLHLDQHIEFVWSSEQCAISENLFGKLKHLDMLDIHNTPIKKSTAILVDDNIDLRGQPNNIYTIPRFSALIEDGDDVELLRVLQTVGKSN